MKGAKSGKAGEKGFKPGGGEGCYLQKGICLWIREDRSGRALERKIGSTYDSPSPIYMFCLGPAEKQVGEE